MSAYVCDNEHISQIARFLSYSYNMHRVQFGSDPETLAQELFDLNERSVRARYPDSSPEADNMPGPVPYGFSYIHSSIAVPDGHTAKALDCFLYQSCEGDCMEDPLYKQVQRAVDNLKDRLLEIHCPDYRNAEWGAYEPKPGEPERHSLTAMAGRKRT